MEPCRPTGPCIRSESGIQPIQACYADGVTSVTTTDERRTYMPDGSLCNSVSYSPTGQVWRDSTGTEVATLTIDEQDGSQWVVCGGNEYHVDVNAPECQSALDAPECVFGDCTAGP